MKTKNKFIPFLFLIFSAYFTNAATIKIAYIYAHDSSRGSEYKLLLSGYGYQVSLFDTNQIGSINFADYKLLLLGENSGLLSSWGNSAKVSQIDNSTLPILGLGEGGYAFFGKLSLTIGWGLGSHSAGTSIYVTSPLHQIFTVPNSIVLPNDSILGVYSSSQTCIVFYPFTPPDPVSYANLSDKNGRCILVKQTARYFLWGFDGSPSNLTNNGKLLLVNIINFMKNPGTSVNEPAVNLQFNIYPDPVVSNLNLDYTLENPGNTVFTIKDITGNVIQTIKNERELAGMHHISAYLNGLASGMYICECEISGTRVVKKFIIQ